MKSLMPGIRGVMDRRILINYRVDPVVLGRLLPPPFRVKRRRCWGVAGICLIRLREIRPTGAPAMLGLSSENAAFRIAVEWEQDGRLHEGVYIPIRHTSSRLNALAGGRVFPGKHELSRFEAIEAGDMRKVSLSAPDPGQCLKTLCRRTSAWPPDSIFKSLEAASEFLRQGCIGYSPTNEPGRFEGLRLHTDSWKVEPLDVEHLQCAWFEDPLRFPTGSIHFDHALLMQGVDHEWRRAPDIFAPQEHTRPPLRSLMHPMREETS